MDAFGIQTTWACPACYLRLVSKKPAAASRQRDFKPSEHVIINKLIDTLQIIQQEYRVLNVHHGMRYAAVQIDGGSIGLGFSYPHSKLIEGLSTLDVENFIGMNAGEMMHWLRDENQFRRSIGMAAMNALINSNEVRQIADDSGYTMSAGDIREILEIQQNEKAVMIGYFAPLVNDLKERCQLEIFEINTGLAAGLKETADAPSALLNADIAIITSTTIANRTLDGLLEACQTCREVVLLGPSTPLLPQAFSDTPVSLLSGVSIENHEIMDIVAGGGGMHQFKSCVRKVNYRLK